MPACMMKSRGDFLPLKILIMRLRILLVVCSFLLFLTSCTEDNPWWGEDGIAHLDVTDSNQIDNMILGVIVTISNPDHSAHRNAYIDLEHPKGNSYNAISDARGNAQFDRVRKGKYTITVVKEDGGSEEFTKVINNNDPVELVLGE